MTAHRIVVHTRRAYQMMKYYGLNVELLVAGQRALHDIGGPGVIASDVAQAIPEARVRIAASE